MAKKLIALFVMCIVAVAALHRCGAEDAAPTKFKECFSSCQKDCHNEGNGDTFCEVKCDGDCTDKEAADKLNGLY